MAAALPTDKDLSLASAADIALVGLDDMSTVRHIHASALRMQAERLSEAEIEAFVSHVYSEAYTSSLAEAARAKRLIGATISGDLIGTAGWAPADDNGTTARLFAVFVKPMFTGAGLGRILALAAEDQAGRAGFETFTVRATHNATEFFQKLGYQVSSRGVWTLGPEQSMPVTFMRKTVRRPPIRPAPAD